MRKRLFWLLVCLMTGLGIGLIGHHFSGDSAWFLALPATLAIGWLVFANPEQCLTSDACRNRDKPEAP